MGAPALDHDDVDEAGEAYVRRIAGTFAVLLPETPASGGRSVMDRIGAGLGPGVDVGVASFPDDGEDAVSLLHVAERGRGGVRSTH